MEFSHTDHREILGWIRGFAAPVVVTYVAGPTGFGPWMLPGSAVWSPRSQKLIRPAGTRVKTDARDTGEP